MSPTTLPAEASLSPHQGVTRLDELTAARGFAACFVVLYHVDAYCGSVLSNAFRPLHYGPLAVDFFFMLSGFVLVHVYGKAWQEGRYSHASFTLKRFARVWPLHAATLLGVAALVFVGMRFGVVPDWQPTASSFVLTVFMLHATGLTPELAWNQPSWSISAEWLAYLAFPLVMLTLVRLPSLVTRALVAVLLFAVCWSAARFLIGHDLMALTNNGGVLRIVPSFFAGAALHGAMTAMGVPDRETNRRITATLTITLALFLALGWFGATSALFWPLIAAMVFLLAWRARSPVAGALRARPLLWLGDISYALYMVHAPVLMLVFGLGGKVLDGVPVLALGALAFALSIVTAHLAHVLIERPAQSAIVKWRWPGRAAVSPR